MSEAAASLATYGYGLQAPITSTTSFQESQGRANPRVGMKGANQLVSPSPKLSFGLSSSSLITITTMYEAFTVDQTLPPLSSQPPHKVGHYDTHFTDELIEVLRNQVLGQGTQQGLECMSICSKSRNPSSGQPCLSGIKSDYNTYLTCCCQMKGNEGI